MWTGAPCENWAVRNCGASRSGEQASAAQNEQASAAQNEQASAFVALADVAPMRFVLLPGGTFQMGSPTGEANRNDDEIQHEATVGPFEMAIHEVTQKQWVMVMGTKPFDCSYGCGDDLPAQNVSWFDAAKFMNGLTYRENPARAEGDKRTRCY